MPRPAVSPSPRWTKLRLYGDIGRLMDYGSGQVADGHVVNLKASFWLGDRVEVQALASRLRMRGGSADAGVDLRQDAGVLTFVYHASVDDSWRLQWTRDAYRRRRPQAERDESQSLVLVYAHRPDWRNRLYVGAGLGSRDARVGDPRAPEVETQRLFVKWSHAFGD